MNNLHRIGHILPAAPGAAERLGVGLEKLDRELYDPAPAYDRVAALGVRYVRIQSGWMRTEKEAGVYDFTWLDDIVDNLLARGLTPWFNVVYGNPLYSERAKRVFGAVGCPPIDTPREREAWDRYAAALALRYAGRVSLFEIWNEPDGQWCWKHGVSGAEYGAFVARTARAIRREAPGATIIGGALASAKNLSFVREALDGGMADAIDALSFHRYTADEGAAAEELRALTALVRQYCPGAAIIQGESGGQSSPDGMGALKGLNWDEDKQVKHLLRQRVVDLAEDVLFTSHFSTLDMAEALNGDVNNLATRLDFGYFGLLSASFDQNGVATGEYKEKPAYAALRALAATLGDATPDAAFAAALAPAILPSPARTCPASPAFRAFARGGKRAVAYWAPVPLMTDTFSGRVSLPIERFTDPVLVDLRDGAIFAPPDGALPITDCPLLLMENGFAPWRADE